MDIKRKQNTSETDSGTESDQKAEEEEKPHPSQDVFRHMQEQLHNCILHHQNTLEYDSYFNIFINKQEDCLSVTSARP